MAENEEQQGSKAGSEKLYTLSEIAKLTKVSMPTLQRYKKLYQARIPSVGEGRRQRYPESSLSVFNELKVENAGRRGRPRKDASAARTPAASPRGRKPGARGTSSRAAAKPIRPAKAAARAPAPAPAAKPAAKPAARRGRPPGAASATRRGQREQPAAKRAVASRGGSRSKEGLLTLTQISKDTNISYPTLVRYVRLYANRLPHEGTGRSRRFYPKAVEVFRALRQESGRGERKRGRPAAPAVVRGQEEGGLARQIKTLEKSQRALEKKLETLLRGLKKAFS